MIQHWLNNWSWTHVRLVQLGWCPRNQGLCDSEGVSIFAENLLANSGHYFSSRLMFWRHFGSQVDVWAALCVIWTLRLGNHVRAWVVSTLWSRGSFGFQEENYIFRTSVTQGLLCRRTLVYLGHFDGSSDIMCPLDFVCLINTMCLGIRDSGPRDLMCPPCESYVSLEPCVPHEHTFSQKLSKYLLERKIKKVSRVADSCLLAVQCWDRTLNEKANPSSLFSWRGGGGGAIWGKSCFMGGGVLEEVKWSLLLG